MNQLTESPGDALAERLRAGAERANTGIRLDDPSVGNVTSLEPRDNRSRHRWLAVAAAAVVAAGAGVAWATLVGDGTSVVDTPPVSVDPPVSFDPGSPAGVVQAAIERTLATSWVAEADLGSGNLSQITYNPPQTNPPETEGDRPLSVVGYGSPGVGRVVLVGGRSFAECEPEQFEPCQPGLWHESPITTAGLPVEHAHRLYEATIFALPGLDPSTAAPVAGSSDTYAVAFKAGYCSLLDDPRYPEECPPAELRITDGLVSTLARTTDSYGSTPQPTSSEAHYSFGDFGTAPVLEVPGEGEVVQIGADADVTWCRHVVQITPGLDHDAIEAEVRARLEDIGNTVRGIQSLMRTPGVINVSSSDQGCSSAGPAIEITEEPI